ncbi:MAG TPA: caspase family protein [Kofleriaceae bacterium]|nr:caspase family protein [Kofleriaceae bacterium]
MLAALCVLTASAIASADVDRFALIVGDNDGLADEQRLRFAESDAARFAELLGEVGGIPDENQVVLRGKSADEVTRALIAMNERIRMRQQKGNSAMLFVYYSGHGDAESLHLGDTRLRLTDLEKLLRGSSAQVRVLVIDACRSGSLTRVKGGKPAPALAISSADDLPGEGVIVLTASTLGEDAQESDELGGSFFTHYLVSAMRGAADDNGDHIVTVAEAFRFTRDQTIVASSRTLSGIQHPTFHYDLRGRSDVALADLAKDSERGTVTLPADATWLVFRTEPAKAVVGEVAAGATQRSLSLRAGTYLLRGRTRDAMLEGTVKIAAGDSVNVETSSLSRLTYARLVRKGRGEVLPTVQGPFAGLAYWQLAPGATLGWTFVRPSITISPRVVGAYHFRPYRMTPTVTSYPLKTYLGAVDVRVTRAWELRHFAVDFGVTIGASEQLEKGEYPLGVQSLTIEWRSVHADLTAGISVPLGGRVYLASELAAQAHIAWEPRKSGDRPEGAFGILANFVAGVWL